MKTLLVTLQLINLFWGNPSQATVKQTDEWKVIHQDDQFRILELNEPDSPIVAFKGEGQLKAPLYQIAAIILNHERTTEWVPHLKTNKLVKMVKPNQYLEYNQMRTPPLTQNRDFLFQTELNYIPQQRRLTISSHSVEDPIQPLDEDFVRGFAERVVFVLTENESGTETEITAEIKVDPKGGIPKWIANLFQRTWPKKAFHGIERQLKDQRIETPTPFISLIEQLKRRT